MLADLQHDSMSASKIQLCHRGTWNKSGWLARVVTYTSTASGRGQRWTLANSNRPICVINAVFLTFEGSTGTLWYAIIGRTSLWRQRLLLHREPRRVEAAENRWTLLRRSVGGSNRTFTIRRYSFVPLRPEKPTVRSTGAQYQPKESCRCCAPRFRAVLYRQGGGLADKEGKHQGVYLIKSKTRRADVIVTLGEGVDKLSD